MRGGGLGLPPPPPQPTPIGDGSFQLPTVPPVPNTNTISPICPSGSHLELNKCVVDNVQCPSGTTQDGDLCSPSLPPCPNGKVEDSQGNCVSPDERTTTVLPGSKTGPQGGFIQMIPSVPPNPDGTCPAGSHNAGGSPGNAGQPGTGSVVCIKNVPVETAPPATPPSNTPPAQPSQPQQVCGPNAGGAACDAAKAAANCPADATLSNGNCFKQTEVPANPDGRCPEGAYSVGSSGNAGQPGTGSIICLKNVPVEAP